MNTSLNSSSQIKEEFSNSLQSQRDRKNRNFTFKQGLYSQVLDQPPHLKQENFQYPCIRDKADNPIAISLLSINKNHPSCSQHTLRNQILISQNTTPITLRAKLPKRMTLNIDQVNQQPQSSFNFKGSLTSRSQTQKLTFTKIGSTFLEESIKEQAQLFKKIEQKALNLKKKEKRQRDILKHLKKQKDTKNEQQMINHSLQIITPQKSKRNHRRTQSHNLQSVFQEKTPSCLIKSREKQENEFGENTRILQQLQQKQTQTNEDKEIQRMVCQLSQNRAILDKLQENLALNRQQSHRLAEEIWKERQQKNVGLIRIQQVITQLQEARRTHFQKINKIQKQFTNQIDTLNQQISNFNLIIEKNQLLLSHNAFVIRQLTQKNTEYQQKIKKMNHQFINLENHYNSIQKMLRDNIDEKISQQNKKQEQNNRQLQLIEKQIKKLKQEKAELQCQKLKERQNFLDMIKDMNKSFKAKQQQMSLKNKIFEQTLERIRNQSSQISKNIISESNRQKLQISKLILANQQKKKQIISLQLALQKAEEHIKKVQSKFHANNIELTEKNVSYDFLFMQIQEERAKVRNLEIQLKLLQQKKQQQGQHHSFLHSSNQIANKEESQNGKSLNRILSTSTIKQINHLKSLIKNPTKNTAKQPIFEQSQEISIPMSHKNNNKIISKLAQSNISIDQPIDDQQYSDRQKQLQIQQIQKPIKTNTILHDQLSDLVDQSEGQDEMIDLVSSKNSNSSKMESSLGAFSQYSRLKSTQSAITHQEEQAQYSTKMKNSKMFAKLNRARKSKN